MKTRAVIFDLDGVLTDTAEMHYQSWQTLADELGIAFDRQKNEALRGLSRPESLRIVLGKQWGDFSAEERQALADRKNSTYLSRVERMTEADLLPGAGALLRAVRQRGAKTAVASSSRNADAVIARLGIRSLLDVVVDGSEAERSKPDPQVFLLAAARLGIPPVACVVVEDAESGVAAALAAGMRVIGIGPPARVGAATLVVGSIAELSVGALLDQQSRG